MGSNAPYVLVGLFVALFTAGLLGFAWWLARHGGEQAFDEYVVYMDESVAGLSVDAAVKYRGVDVGTVAQISLAPDDPERVRLLLKVRHGTPVKTDTTATLRFYGVTGLAYIELQGRNRNAPRLRSHNGEPPVIPAQPSTITRLDDALSSLAERSQRVLDRLDRLLGDENQRNFAALLRDSRDLVHGLRNLSASVKHQINRFGQLVEKGIEMEQQVTRSFLDVTDASENVARLADALQRTYVALGRQTDRLVDRSGVWLQRVMLDLDGLVNQLRSTVDELHDGPAEFFFSRSTPRPGPGESIP